LRAEIIKSECYADNWADHPTLSPTVVSLPISPTDHFPIICSSKITNSPTAPTSK